MAKTNNSLTKEEAVNKFHYNLSAFQKTMEAYTLNLKTEMQCKAKLNAVSPQQGNVLFDQEDVKRQMMLLTNSITRCDNEKNVLLNKAYEHFAMLQSLLKAKVKD